MLNTNTKPKKNQFTYILNEYNFYELIINSKKFIISLYKKEMRIIYNN